MNKTIRILFLITWITFMTKMTMAQSKIADSAEDICPVPIGNGIPNVRITALDGTAVHLLDIIHQKPTVIIFYRGGWCPYCNRQLMDLQALETELQNLGYQIIAISSDRPEMLRDSLYQHHLMYDLFSDSDAVASSAFGIAFRESSQMVSEYKKYGLDIEKAAGNHNHILPVPAVFICNTEGVIQFEYVNPNYKIRLDGQVLLAAAKAYKD